MSKQQKKKSNKPVSKKKSNVETVVIVALLVIALAVGIIISSGGFGGGSSNTTDSSDKVLVTSFDVGKGDCNLVVLGNKAMLIDAGYEDTYENVKANLNALGIYKLDVLVVSHYDKDHAGGAAKVVEEFSPKEIYIPSYEGSGNVYEGFMEALEKAGITASKVPYETVFSFDKGTVSLYGSQVEYNGKNDNDCSLVCSFAYGEDAYLFAGDLEEEGIKAFVKNHPGNWDVIKLPHHGNNADGLKDLLDSVKPSVALITDSSKDPASDEVLKLLEDAKIEIHRTGTAGSIIVQSDGTGKYSAI